MDKSSKNRNGKNGKTPKEPESSTENNEPPPPRCEFDLDELCMSVKCGELATKEIFNCYYCEKHYNASIKNMTTNIGAKIFTKKTDDGLTICYRCNKPNMSISIVNYQPLCPDCKRKSYNNMNKSEVSPKALESAIDWSEKKNKELTIENNRLDIENKSIKSFSSCSTGSRAILEPDNQVISPYLNSCCTYRRGFEKMCPRCVERMKQVVTYPKEDLLLMLGTEYSKSYDMKTLIWFYVKKHCNEKCHFCSACRKIDIKTEQSEGATSELNFLKSLKSSSGQNIKSGYRFITVSLDTLYGDDNILSILGKFKEKLVGSKTLKIINHFGCVALTPEQKTPHLHVLVKYEKGHGVRLDRLFGILNTAFNEVLCKPRGTQNNLNRHSIHMKETEGILTPEHYFNYINNQDIIQFKFGNENNILP